MKKTLFTAALLFVAYCLVVVLYSFAADSGMIARSVRSLGLIHTSTTLHQTAVSASSSQASLGGFIDPVPPPPIPKPPQVQTFTNSVIDPVPPPPIPKPPQALAFTNSVIDPVPPPPIPKPPETQTFTSSFIDPVPPPPIPKPPQA